MNGNIEDIHGELLHLWPGTYFKQQDNSRKSVLNKHIALVHEGKNPFKCELCNHTFFQKSNLNVHVASIHDGKKSFKWNC